MSEQCRLLNQFYDLCGLYNIIDMAYETVIGLEVHIQLNTKSKAFSSEINEFNLSPNEHISAITLALPGTLPVANANHVRKAIKLGLALGCKINRKNYFDRKNYFYPDLPKGYQITQDGQPICIGGTIEFESQGVMKSIRIHHIHMEEDAGKSNHELDPNYSLVDYNRAGTPLVELVTEPDFRSGQEVHDFYAYIQKVVQYLDVSDGNMEEGSIRCDCNVSVRKEGEEYGARREIKNVNSKKFARQAINYESTSQIEILENGGEVYVTTMLFDPVKGTTSPMRLKETENDYRYFPEPDMGPIEISDELIEEIKATIDWMPKTMERALVDDYDVPLHHVKVLLDKKQWGVDFMSFVDATSKSKNMVDLVVIKLIPELAEGERLADLLSVAQISDVLSLIDGGKAAKGAVFKELIPSLLRDKEASVNALAESMNLLISNDTSEIDEVIAKILADNPDKVNAFRKGKKGLIGFFMGQVMRAIKNKVDPKVLNQKLGEALRG